MSNATGAIGIKTVVQGLHTEQVIRMHVLAVIASKRHNRRIILAIFLSLLVPFELIVCVEIVLSNAFLI